MNVELETWQQVKWETFSLPFLIQVHFSSAF